jgi:hypothetical protein
LPFFLQQQVKATEATCEQALLLSAAAADPMAGTVKPGSQPIQCSKGKLLTICGKSSSRQPAYPTWLLAYPTLLALSPPWVLPQGCCW